VLDGAGVDQAGVGVVGPEGGARALDVVEDDQVEVLCLQLSAGRGACAGVDQAGVGVVGPEGGARALDVVEDDQVEVLGLQLAAGAGQVVAGLGGEADQDLVGAAAAAQLGQGVGGRF